MNGFCSPTAHAASALRCPWTLHSTCGIFARAGAGRATRRLGSRGPRTASREERWHDSCQSRPRREIPRDACDRPGCCEWRLVCATGSKDPGVGGGCIRAARWVPAPLSLFTGQGTGSSVGPLSGLLQIRKSPPLQSCLNDRHLPSPAPRKHTRRATVDRTASYAACSSTPSPPSPGSRRRAAPEA